MKFGWRWLMNQRKSPGVPEHDEHEQQGQDAVRGCRTTCGLLKRCDGRARILGGWKGNTVMGRVLEMCNHLGPFEILCDAPPYAVVRSLTGRGLQSPLEVA